MTDYFTKNGNYSETLPWKKKVGSSSIEVQSLNVTEGVISFTACRVTMYGDIAETWSMCFAHPDSVESYKKKDGVKTVSGVVWAKEGSTEWGQFVPDSNCGRLWDTVKKFLETHEPDFVPGSDVPDSADEKYKKVVTIANWKWDYFNQIRNFAAYHQTQTNFVISDWSLYKKNQSFSALAGEVPDLSEFEKPHWPDLRAKSLEVQHTWDNNKNICLICLDEAESGDGPVPPLLKVAVSLSQAEELLGSESDSEIAKQIRWQVSAFAYFHDFNRWKASQIIKEAGEWGKNLTPFLLPAEKNSAKPDYYKLPSMNFPDVWLTLHKGGNWTCTCTYCAQFQAILENNWVNGSAVDHLVIPKYQDLFPKKAKKKAKFSNEISGSIPTTKISTSGPKNVDCLLTAAQFDSQLGSFSAYHAINLKTAYDLLPALWKQKHPRDFGGNSPADAKDFTDPATLLPEPLFGEIAFAIQCKCSVCMKWVKKTPTKYKKAMTVKKLTKKAKIENAACMEMTLGMDLEVDPSALAIPIKSQALAYAAWHGQKPSDVWKKYVNQEKFGKQPFHPDTPSGYIEDSGADIWPDIDTECICDVCVDSRKKALDAPETEVGKVVVNQQSADVEDTSLVLKSGEHTLVISQGLEMSFA